MNEQPAVPGGGAGTASPPAPAHAYEPCAPAAAEAWDTRSRALIEPAAPADATAEEAEETAERKPGGGAPVAAGPELVGSRPEGGPTGSGAAGSGGSASAASAGAPSAASSSVTAPTVSVPAASVPTAAASAVASFAVPRQARTEPSGPAPGSQPADPVRRLLHRHRELCERAVDPLEIAAGLEAHGVTDRVAGRFRHRDVFSLAEELFARVPRAEGGRPGAASATGARSGHPGGPGGHSDCSCRSCRGAARAGTARRVLSALLWVLPGTLAAAAVAVSVRAESPGGWSAPVGAAAVGTGLACALVPAVWWAHWFAARARRRLVLSRSLAEFASGARLSLTASVLLFAATAAGLQLAAGSVARALAVLAGGGAPAGGVLSRAAMPVVTALGVLLFAALLLALHGMRGRAAAGLVAACVLQAAAVRGIADVPASSLAAAACGAVALALLACGYRRLAVASAHSLPDAACGRCPPDRAQAAGRGACTGCERCADRGCGASDDGRAARPGRICHDGHHGHAGRPAGCCGAVPHGRAP